MGATQRRDAYFGEEVVGRRQVTMAAATSIGTPLDVLHKESTHLAFVRTNAQATSRLNEVGRFNGRHLREASID